MGKFRKNFGRVKKVLDIPNLIEIQTVSYEKFLQKDLAPAKRGNVGCRALLRAFSRFQILAGNVLWNLSAIKLEISGTILKSVFKKA